MLDTIHMRQPEEAGITFKIAQLLDLPKIEQGKKQIYSLPAYILFIMNLSRANISL